MRRMAIEMYFDYPLEQGLRHRTMTNNSFIRLYFDYPLEQGLRHDREQQKLPLRHCILIIH